MLRLHPTIIASSVALCALLGCERTRIEKEGPGDSDEMVVEGKRAVAQPEPPTRPVPETSAAAPSGPSEAREALSPQAPAAGEQSPPGAAPAPSGASPGSERLPTSGTAAEDGKAQEDVVEGEGADRGSPSDTCVRGWVRPRAGSKLRKAALDMLRQQRGERFVVIEMRYFVGPEDAEVIGPQRQVERWYVKARSLADR